MITARLISKLSKLSPCTENLLREEVFYCHNKKQKILLILMKYYNFKHCSNKLMKTVGQNILEVLKFQKKVIHLVDHLLSDDSLEMRFL